MGDVVETNIPQEKPIKYPPTVVGDINLGNENTVVVDDNVDDEHNKIAGMGEDDATVNDVEDEDQLYDTNLQSHDADLQPKD